MNDYSSMKIHELPVYKERPLHYTINKIGGDLFDVIVYESSDGIIDNKAARYVSKLEDIHNILVMFGERGYIADRIAF